MSSAVIANQLLLLKGEGSVQQHQSLRIQPGVDAQGRLTPQGAACLKGSELEVIRARTESLQPAIETAKRTYRSVRGLREEVGAYRDERGGGVWGSLLSTICGAPTIGLGYIDSQKRIIEQKISLELADLKRVVERVLFPSLQDLRDLFRGKTFEKTAETPKALLLVSIPTEKVGKILSFDEFRAATQIRVRKNSGIKTVDGGDGRIILIRTIAGQEECLEFSYRRPGKVDIYLDGKRQGGMWTDDAYAVVRAFSRGQELTFKKQKRFTEYTVC
jgi:hypothetical protein